MEIYKLRAISQILNSAVIESSNFNASTSFKIAGLKRKLQPIIDQIEESRKSLVDKYGKKDEDNNLITNENGEVTITNVEGFNTEWLQLMNTIENIDVPKFKLSELENVKSQMFFDIMFDFIEE